MGWKIVEIENGEKLNLFLDNLIIWRDNDKITIPINTIDVLLISNYMINISVQLLLALSENNVLTIVCDKQYIPSCNVLPIIGNFNTLKVLEKQLQWNNEIKGVLWKEIIKLKIKNQSDFLLNVIKNNQASVELNKLMKEIKEFDVSNREGHAAKIYWHNIFGKKWKRHEDDYFNRLLNYGYSVLRSYFCRSIIKKGLDPRIALFHRSYHNYFALASDLMEPFRVIIDFEVFNIAKIGEIDFYKHKNQLINSFNKKIIINNKYNFVNNAIDDFIDGIINGNQILDIKINYD